MALCRVPHQGRRRASCRTRRRRSFRCSNAWTPLKEYAHVCIASALAAAVPPTHCAPRPRQRYQDNGAALRYRAQAPGFPTLRSLAFTCKLEFANVRVFDMESKGDSMALTLLPEPRVPTEELAQAVLLSRSARVRPFPASAPFLPRPFPNNAPGASFRGCSCFVGWPNLREALVLAVSDGVDGYGCERTPDGTSIAITSRSLTREEVSTFASEAGRHQGTARFAALRTIHRRRRADSDRLFAGVRKKKTESALRRTAVNIGPVVVLLGVVPLRSMRRTATGALVRVRLRFQARLRVPPES